MKKLCPIFLFLVFVQVKSQDAETEYARLIAMDDAALIQIDAWIRSSQRPDAKDVESISLAGKIRMQIQPVRAAYESFVKKNPKHVKARMTFASFLLDIGDAKSALPHLLKAVALAPELPSAQNNLANHYAQNGEPKKAFPLFEKAIALDPNQSLYYRNFASALFLFRKIAQAHYEISEKSLFQKILDLYEKACLLAPDDFDLAEDLAQIHYGIGSSQKALLAWKKARSLAPSDFEREGISIHLARVHIDLKNFEKARKELDKITLAIYSKLKDQLEDQLQIDARDEVFSIRKD